MRSIFGFAIIWFVVMVIPPFIIKVKGGDEEAMIVQMREANNGHALYIFPGMCSPSAEAGFRQFADAYDGDVWFVQYPHGGCSMDLYCDQVYRHVAERCYRHVDILGISIGAQTYATLYYLFAEYRLNSFHGYGFWSICPFSPATANYDILDKSTKAMPVVRLAKDLLGLVGRIPCIYWDGVWRSLSGIFEQGYIAIEGRPLWTYVDTCSKMPLWTHPEEDSSLDARREIKGIVMAKKDALANNQRIETFYQATPLAYANGDHCDFKEHGDDYVTALRNLGLFK